MRRLLPEWQQAVHALALHNGFWESGHGVHELASKLALVHSEVSEALECLRKGDMAATVRPDGKPEGWASELADIVIRVLDIAEATGVDIGAAMAEKHRHNLTRPYKHGKAL